MAETQEKIQSWASDIISDAEIRIKYTIFQKDRVGQRESGGILYLRNSIPVVLVHIGNNADNSKSLWCNIDTLNLLETIGLMYHKPNLAKTEKDQIQYSINMFNNRDCKIMENFNYGTIKSDGQESMFITQDQFLRQQSKSSKY